MLPTPLPGIQHVRLTKTVIMLKAMGIRDVTHFDFMDAPAVEIHDMAKKELRSLTALSMHIISHCLASRYVRKYSFIIHYDPQWFPTCGPRDSLFSLNFIMFLTPGIFAMYISGP
jgi:hypothetical protein